MSDLISRSELINKIRGIVPGSQDVDFIVRLIENQPTAYNIGKVVEEIEKANQGCCNYCGCDLYSDDVIEIVKQGGISDEVCEWENDDDNLITSCGDYFNLYDNCTGKFKYCSYCGKKIKVVE